MKFVASTVLVSVLLSSIVQTADAGSLAPGKPAGIRKAQDVGESHMLLYIALGAAAIAGIAIAASSDDSKPAQPQTPTTTATST